MRMLHGLSGTRFFEHHNQNETYYLVSFYGASDSLRRFLFVYIHHYIFLVDDIMNVTNAGGKCSFILCSSDLT